MRLLILSLCSISLVWADDLIQNIGPFSLNQQEKFDDRELGKDPQGHAGLTLANQSGLAIHFQCLADKPDIESLFKDEAIPKDQLNVAKIVNKEIRQNGLIGKSITVRFKDPDEGNVVTQLGYLQKGKDYIHWEINAREREFDAKEKIITAIMGSIK